MALEKLKLLVESGPNRFEERLTALFNPDQIHIRKTVNWNEQPVAERDVPAFQFTHGHAARLHLDLFFDTYEARTDVRKHTREVFALATVEGHGNLHRPPICQLMWGKLGVFFQGVLERLTQSFTLFLEDGTPVRARLSCTFREWQSAEEEGRRQKKESADVAKTHTVRRGDTLSGIATEAYHDPSLWRPIAEANQIDNPRVLTPGQVLIIPTLGMSEAAGRQA